ncbi:MAG TPA: sigma-70 family RNA polymerase sigma factor [Verrucomicrobiae bacterium]|nr:sigma-70 family RNA polymerase sigma factor [Verrucomicrobiae bacterium]
MQRRSGRRVPSPRCATKAAPVRKPVIAKAEPKKAATPPPVLVKVPPLRVGPEAPMTLETLDNESRDAFQMYIREIGQTPLLTQNEEVLLARKIKRGDNGAREHMIKANLRLVVKIAREYEGMGLPLLDLINEGNIGLMKAVERFDPTKGAKFSTYSAWWIKQAIKRALSNQSKEIRLPIHLVQKLFNMRRTAAKLEGELGREPTEDELAEEMDASVEDVRHWRSSAAISASSLDAPLGDDEDARRVQDVVADENADTPLESLEDKTSTELVREMVATLDPREQFILKTRFGLDGDDEKTLEEVGETFGVTRERIRQIQDAALRKLRRRMEKLESKSLAA